MAFLNSQIEKMRLENPPEMYTSWQDLQNFFELPPSWARIIISPQPKHLVQRRVMFSFSVSVPYRFFSV